MLGKRGTEGGNEKVMRHGTIGIKESVKKGGAIFKERAGRKG